MMYMKKTIVIMLVSMLAILLLASCSASNSMNATPGEIGGALTGGGGTMDTESAAMPSGAPMAPMPMPSPSIAPDGSYDSYDRGGVVDDAMAAGESAVAPITAPDGSGGLAEKIIYSVYADIETVNFDETISRVNEMLAGNGAFIESSYIGGRNYAQTYYGWQTYRTAQFTLRIPKDRLNAVTASLDAIGNVTSLRSEAQNITSQFFDTQSRLNSYKTQESRLLDMLAKADNVTDMITIEQRLADVRYSIESLTTTLNNWQNQVDYSTLTLSIQEVEKFTEITPVQQRTYWQQIGDGFKTSTQGVGRFFMNLFKWVLVNLPVLIIIAVIIAVAVIIARRRLRRGKNRGRE